MSSLRQADVNLSLDEFSRHGGIDTRNHDGWGIAYYEGQDVRLIKEAGPAGRSPWMPSLEARLDIVISFADVIRRMGPANFIYSDSDYLFAHGDIRRHADGTFRPPGLYSLTRTCMDDTGSEPTDLSVSDAAQQVTLLASVPYVGACQH